jgi:hypothetical protein
MEVLPKSPSVGNRRPRDAMAPDKKPNAVENSSTKFSRRVKNATSTTISSPAAPVTQIFRYGDGLAHRPEM